MTKPTYENITRVGHTYYDLDDPCLKCGHAFECTEEGKTKAGAYPQMSTLNKRQCLECGKLQEWPLKAGKQPWLHKIDDEMLEVKSGG